MIHGSAAARLGRALNTRTTQAAPTYELRVGCEVDFYRDPNAKDTSGWSGPAIVTDISQQHRGIVTIKWHGKTMQVMLSRIRHSLHFLVFLQSHAPVSPQANSWRHIRDTVNGMRSGSQVTLGRVPNGESWAICEGNARYPKLMSAIKFLATNTLKVANVVTARIYVGARTIPMIASRTTEQTYVSSALLMWIQEQNHFGTHYQECYNGISEKISLCRLNDSWENSAPTSPWATSWTGKQKRRLLRQSVSRNSCQRYQKAHTKTARAARHTPSILAKQS